MSSKNFLIAPLSDGLNRSVEPWQLPENAFATLQNAYQYEGKIYKKRGVSLLGRLTHLSLKAGLPDFLGNTAGAGTTFTGTTGDQPIEPGSLTVTVGGAITMVDNGNGTLADPAAATWNFGTIDYESGTVVLTMNPGVGAAIAVNATAYRIVDREPLMGLAQYEQPEINEEELIAFDQSRAYEWNIGGGFFRNVSFYKMNLAVPNNVYWYGSDSQFFWTTNYYDVLWATNNEEAMHARQLTGITNAANAVITVGAGHPFIVGDVVFINEVTGMTQINGLTGTVTAIAAATITVNINSAAFGAYAGGGYVFGLTTSIDGFSDGIRYYDGFGLNLGWTNFQPYLQEAEVTPTYLRGCKIILPFKDRIVCLSTWEGLVAGAAVEYPQRARWCQNGTPFYATDVAPTVAPASRAGSQWAEDIPGKGGYIDAPTDQAIVGAHYTRDTLLVFFERSTWQLRYTGNEVLPFVWEQINSELGSESTFSTVGFDKGVLAVGDKRLIAADSNDVKKIDDKVPHQVFRIENENDGTARVHGIRDFYVNHVYWCYRDCAGSGDIGNYVLKFPNRILAFNYEEDTWAEFIDSYTCFGVWQKREDYTWATLPFLTWSSWTSPWNSAISQSFFPNIIGGNQRGIVMLFDETSIENGISLDITNSIPIPSITAANPALIHIPNHNLETGQFVKFWWTRAFPINVVNEALGTAPLGATAHTGTIANLGLFTGSLSVTVAGVGTLQDIGNGTLVSAVVGLTGTIDYMTGNYTILFAALGAAAAVTASYTYNDLNFRSFYVNWHTDSTFSIYEIDADGNPQPFDGTAYANYAGSGSLSVIDNFKVTTKRFNPFVESAEGLRISYVDLFLATTDSASFTLDVLVDESSSEPIASLGVPTSIDYKDSIASEKLWQRAYINSTGTFLQLEAHLSYLQMVDETHYAADWVLHGINLNLQPAGRTISFS